MSGVRRYRKQWQEFVAYLAKGERPDTFEDCWNAMPPHVCGQYEAEARALWTILRGEDIKSLVEVGRNLGGGLFLFMCACPDLEVLQSFDIRPVTEIDEALKEWAATQGIDGYALEQHDSLRPLNYQIAPPDDFVYIDGGHTGEIVRADIEQWKDDTRLIGFHDYADKGWNKHVRRFRDVTAEITKARDEYGWVQVGERAGSEVIFRTEHY